MKIIRKFEDVDFMELPRELLDKTIKEPVENDNIAITFRPSHGTVCYVDEIQEDDPDTLWCFGAEPESNEYRIAFHKGFRDFQRGWYTLIGRNDLVQELNKCDDIARRIQNG